MEWADQALCKGKHLDLWYPPHKEERTAPESHYHEIAKMVCERCPVKEQCHAQGELEEHGVWAGWTAKERKTGDFRPSKRTLPRAHAITVIPRHVVGERLDIEALRLRLKRYTERRHVA